jgi:diketogulonate reductase-like aldo/keto reductase
MINIAIQNGVQAFDTVFNLDSDAEEITGDHLLSLYRSSSLTREHVFLQAKYTPLFNRKDLSFENYVKYYANMTLESQVTRSFYRILRKLRTSKIDVLLLHYPMPHFQDTLIIWNEFEKLVNNGEVDYLGLSNFYDINLLTTIWERSNIKPKILQNNYCKEHSYDTEIREFCKEHNIIYQSYSVIPSNKDIVNNNLLIELSKSYSKTPAQIWLSYLSQKDINIITGTNTEEYIKDNIEATLNIKLSENEIKEIDNIVYGH